MYLVQAYVVIYSIIYIQGNHYRKKIQSKNKIKLMN